MTSRGTPSRYLGSVLRNGLGRYVCQLQRLSLAFSPGGQTSRGARGYIEEKVLDFAKQNPGVVVYVTPQKCRTPTLVAEYCGRDKDKFAAYTELSPEEQLCVAQKFVFVSSANKMNGAVREEIIADKTVTEITQLVQKLANQSGLEIIRIRKPFHTDNPSIQGQWHPFTNKPSALPLQSLRRLEQQPNKV